MSIGLKNLGLLLTVFGFLGSTSTFQYRQCDQENQPTPTKIHTLFEKELIFLEDLQYYPQMTHVFIFTLGIYQDIINKDDYKLIKIILEHPIHKAHESLRGIS